MVFEGKWDGNFKKDRESNGESKVWCKLMEKKRTEDLMEVLGLKETAVQMAKANGVRWYGLTGINPDQNWIDDVGLPENAHGENLLKKKKKMFTKWAQVPNEKNAMFARGAELLILTSAWCHNELVWECCYQAWCHLQDGLLSREM